MAVEDQAKADFEEILTNLNRKYEIILVKWTDCRDFEIRIRTEIDRDNDDFNGLCDQWVDLFSSVTGTVWVKKISNTGPKIRFRKQYQCWTHGLGKIQKELLFDSRRCKGVLDMKVLTDTPLTRRKNKHIRLGLNAVVKINFSHLHPVSTNGLFSFFVHNCPPQADPMLAPQPTLIQQSPLIEPMKHLQPQQAQEQTTDLSEPLLMCQPTLMFDTSLTTHAISFPHHIVHPHAQVHTHNPMTTQHGHYLH